ncbi:MAG: glycosyltransferase family 2 protein [Ruminococcus sp.]|jgi:glycosyltransferase involved in cell wall biosynthesis|nr:glycosyltransferase family 2 protein [Ruminococcus sp.]
MKLSLIVPCYNEEDNVELFYEECVKAFSKTDIDYEFVFVNDGSRDKTIDKLKKLYNEKTESDITVISFSRNFGKESAIYAGIKNSKGDYISLIDADMQQRPEVVIEMMEILENEPEYDCVAAYQSKRKEGSVMTGLKSGFYKLINKLSEVELHADASDFRTFTRGVADAILEMGEYHRFSKGIFSWIGFNTKYIPYEVQERNAGETKWSFTKLVRYAFEGISAFSTKPLKLATYTGMLTSFASIVYLIVVVIQRIWFNVAISGYATIVALILLLGGIQLFCIGIIGSYLAKTYIQSKQRPIYIAKEILTRK